MTHNAQTIIACYEREREIVGDMLNKLEDLHEWSRAQAIQHESLSTRYIELGDLIADERHTQQLINNA